MFGNDKDIKELEPNDGRTPVPTLVTIGFTGFLATSALISEYWNSGDEEVHQSSMTANEMFCENPNLGADFFADPYKALNQNPGILYKTAEKDYKLFWDADNGHKIISIPMDYNETDLGNRRDSLQRLLRDVIDRPEVTFIVAGNATYDLDEKYPFANVHKPKGFDEEKERHLRNNFKIAGERVKSTREILMSLGIDKSRIVEINHGVRYDKSDVDISVCVPPEPL